MFNSIKRLGQAAGLTIPLLTSCASTPEEGGWAPDLSGSVTAVNRYNAKGILAVDKPSLQVGVNGELRKGDIALRAGVWSSSAFEDLSAPPQEVDYSVGVALHHDDTVYSLGYTRLTYPDGSLGEAGDTIDAGVSTALGDLRATLAAKYLFAGETHTGGTRYSLDLTHPIVGEDRLRGHLSGAVFDDFYQNGEQIQVGLGGRLYESVNWKIGWQKAWGDLEDQFLASVGFTF